MVSSQERRELVVPRINRASTTRCVPPSVYIGFRLFVLPKEVQDSYLRCSGGQEGRLYSGRIYPSASHPAPARPAPPPCSAPPRPDPPVECPCFGFDKPLGKRPKHQDHRFVSGKFGCSIVALVGLKGRNLKLLVLSNANFERGSPSEADGARRGETMWGRTGAERCAKCMTSRLRPPD